MDTKQNAKETVAGGSKIKKLLDEKTFQKRPPVRSKKEKKRPRTPAERKIARQKRMVEEPSKRPIFVKVEPPPPSETIDNTPHYQFKVIFKTNTIDVKVNLPHVPIQYIICDPQEARFKLNTLQWSKKWVLDKEYPDGILVDPLKGKAEVLRGVLTCSLPITFMPETVLKKHQQIAQTILEGKQLRFIQGFKGDVLGMRMKKEIPKKAEKGPKNEKKKKKVTYSYLPFDDEKTSEKEEDVVKEVEEEVVEDKTPKEFIKKNQKSKVKKTFLIDKDTAMQIIDEVTDIQKSKVDAKQRGMTSLDKYIEEKKEIKKFKKEKRETQRQKILRKLVEKRTAKKAEFLRKPPLASGIDANKLPSKKKVSFSSVTTFLDNKDSKKKHRGPKSVTEFKNL